MALRYRVPLPGPFYYSGRVGPKHWLPRSSSGTGSGLFYFAMKWLVVYPSVFFFGVSVALLLAPFYGLFWLVRRWQRNRWGRRPVVPCPPVRRPGLQCSAPYPVSGSYGFVPAQRPVRPVSYGFIPAQESAPAPAYVPSPGVPRG